MNRSSLRIPLRRLRDATLIEPPHRVAIEQPVALLQQLQGKESEPHEVTRRPDSGTTTKHNANSNGQRLFEKTLHSTKTSDGLKHS